MVTVFYIFGIIAILFTICAISHYHPVYALLYLVLSFLSMSCIFFCLGAPFAGAIEIIVYAGAIMILFIFVVMMLNTKTVKFFVERQPQDSRFLNPILCCGVALLVSILFVILIYTVFASQNYFINTYQSTIDSKQVGMTLFGPYILVVELASFLLLGALVSVFHLSQEHKYNSVDCIISTQSQERKHDSFVS